MAQLFSKHNSELIIAMEFYSKLIGVLKIE